MVQFTSIPARKSINKSYLKIKPFRDEFENFKKELTNLLSCINDKESEEHNKKFVSDFLSNTFYANKFINTKGKTDLAIFQDKLSKSNVSVIIETKSPVNKADMISESDLNRKAMQEVILYYLRERIESKNDEIKKIIITNGYEWFIFKADQFEKYFYRSNFKKEYEKWKDNQKVSSNNDFFYNEIIKNYLNDENFEIEGIHLDLRDYEKLKGKDEIKLIALFKIFSPAELLKEPFANDSNTLNKNFYLELLHVIGLEEFKEGSKKTIRRKDKKDRDNGALLENTIRILKSEDSLTNLENPEQFGENEDERLFNLALELNITWINRILFLKLLEAQLVNYHKGDQQFKFLDPKVILEYDDLYELFHEVLAKKVDERSSDIINKFKNIPYLNSSLFDISELERKTIRISNLKDRFKLNFSTPTVFSRETQAKDKFLALEYLLRFLDAYDFASEAGEEIQEERKTIINASVLGLIFEKINGYKEGSFYTPGFITMYMARETLRRAVVQKFNEAKGTGYNDYEELKKNIDISSAGREEANKIINSLKICDPAVGSGHFLVSCLNEIIAIKADLRILTDREGRRIIDYSFTIENDELIITHEETDELFSYYLNDGGKPVTLKQELQETLFHEKETIIENCLFGVDINPNSVNICRLRLWIELLKNSYYTKDSAFKELETLPNIDINIKQGNSLISRFDLEKDDFAFSAAELKLLDVYKLNVNLYKNEQDKAKRRELKASIDKTKARFKGYGLDPLKKETEQIEKLTEQLHDLNKEDLFASELTEKQKEKIEKQRETLTQKINKLSAEKKEKIEEYKSIYSEAFEWRFEFPEVLDEQGKFVGFDVVIGNPPFVPGKEMTVNEKIFYKLHFPFLVGKYDLYLLFIIRSLEILSTKLFAMIIPNTFLSNENALLLREHLVNNSLVDSIRTFDNKVFDLPSVENIVLLLSNNSNNSVNIYNASSGRNIMPYKNIKSNNNYRILVDFREDELNLLEKIKAQSLFLEDISDICIGIQLGGAGDSSTFKGKYIANKKLSDSYKKIIDGKEIEPYHIRWNGNYLKYGNWLHRKRDEKYFNTQKIIFRQIGKYPYGTIDYDNYYTLNTIYNIIIIDKEYPLEFVYAIINSKLIKFYWNKKFSDKKTLFPKIKKTQLNLIPIKRKPLVSEKDKLLELVKVILHKKKENPEVDTSKLEQHIDQMIYQLYGLTEEEIKIVEGVNG